MVYLILKVENVTNDPCSRFCRSRSHICKECVPFIYNLCIPCLDCTWSLMHVLFIQCWFKACQFGPDQSETICLPSFWADFYSYVESQTIKKQGLWTASKFNRTTEAIWSYVWYTPHACLFGLKREEIQHQCYSQRRYMLINSLKHCLVFRPLPL